MGEVATFAQVLSHTGILKAIQERVRFARFGHYDVIDFVVVLIGKVEPEQISSPGQSSIPLTPLK